MPEKESEMHSILHLSEEQFEEKLASVLEDPEFLELAKRIENAIRKAMS
jgi:hypothetical protein